MPMRRYLMQLLCLLLVQPLTGCFETLEREPHEDSSEPPSVVEDVFESEVEVLNSLTLNNSSLDGLWIVFNVETDSNSSSEGINRWNLLKLDLIGDVVSISNYADCTDDVPVSYDYDVESSLLTPGTFDISTTNSFLHVPASSTVFAQIESANEISFSDYSKSSDLSRQIVMRAFKLRDSYSDEVGDFVINNFAYDVDCAAYTHVWSEEEDTLGNTIKVPVYTLQGSGIDELSFTFVDDASKDADSASVLSVSVRQGDSIDYEFSTEVLDGSADQVALSILGDLSSEASFEGANGESGSLLIDLK